MFYIDEHVEVINGKDKGKRGRVQGVSSDHFLYDVYLVEDKCVMQYSKDELQSLED